MLTKSQQLKHLLGKESYKGVSLDRRIAAQVTRNHSARNQARAAKLAYLEAECRLIKAEAELETLYDVRRYRLENK